MAAVGNSRRTDGAAVDAGGDDTDEEKSVESWIARVEGAFQNVCLG
jgi:hypothetical protein